MALCSWPALLAWISFAFVAARARARFGRPRQRFALRAIGFWFVFALRVLAVRARVDLVQAGRFGGFFSFFRTVRALVSFGRLSIYPFLFNRRCMPASLPWSTPFLSCSTSSLSMFCNG